MESGVNNTTVYTSVFDADSSSASLIWFGTIAGSICYSLGFMGNLLSLIIFSQEEFRKVSTGFLFLLMTISNTIHLWTLTTEFLGIFNIYVYSNIFLQCRFNYFIQNLSRSMSTYFAITIALDRLVRSEFPIRSRRICTRRNVMKLAIIYLIVFCILYSFWFCPLNTINPDTGVCYSGQPSRYTYFISNVFLPGRLVLVCIIPVLVMSVANIRMLLNIRQSRRRVEQGNANNAGLVLHRMTPLDRMLFCMMLISVSTFTVTQIPFHVYTIVQNKYSPLDVYTNLLVRGIVLSWSSIYFGIGFYVYCLASPLFREKFVLMAKILVNCIRRPRPV